MTGEELVGDHLVVSLGGVMKVASSMHGVVDASHVVFSYVDKGFSVDDVDGYSARVAESLGLDPRSTVVFFTAVESGRYVKTVRGEVTVYATVGLRPPVCIEMESLYEAPTPGTINVLVVVESPVTEPALLDLYRVAAEAKCLASSMLGLRCGSRSPGTVTDAVAVAARVGPRGPRWAGMATRLGNTVARLVYSAIVKGDDRSLDEKLRGFLGLGVEELVEEALRIYRAAPVPGVPEQAVKQRIRSMLEKALRDPNVWSFIVAARELDLYGAAGLIPGLSREEFLGDSKRIVADEALEVALAVYLAGFRGLLSSYWVDREKHRLAPRIAGLPVFEDDVAAALVGSILSRLYDELLGTGL